MRPNRRPAHRNPALHQGRPGVKSGSRLGGSLASRSLASRMGRPARERDPVRCSAGNPRENDASIRVAGPIIDSSLTPPSVTLAGSLSTDHRHRVLSNGENYAQKLNDSYKRIVLFWEIGDSFCTKSLTIGALFERIASKDQ